MKITEKLRGALRRVGGRVSAADETPGRRTLLPMPSILNTYTPRQDALPKPTARNLRRFAEMPVARKAINTVKDRIAGMRWRVQPKAGRAPTDIPEGAERVRVLTEIFESPNPDDSFRSFAEQVLEDVIVGGSVRRRLS